MKRAIAALLVLLATADELRAQTPDSAAELVGLWSAQRRFGPDARGTLRIVRSDSGFTADMLGFTMPVIERNGELSFALPNRAGEFRGRLERADRIRGVWFQAPLGSLGPATPVTLLREKPGRWSGEVRPEDDRQTFHLLVRNRPDGSLTALLRNPERDYGAILGVSGLVRDGNRLGLVARRGAPPRDTVVVAGSYDAARQVMTFNFPYRGGSYDFRRDDDELSGFYPRGRNPGRYIYRAPFALDDGWPIASVDDVDIDRAAIERAVQHLITMSMDSINAPQIHSLLIARRGRLVVEEYFHHEHRTRLHNTRSGSKSVTATIIGAALHSGAPLRLSSSVYEVMNDGTLPAGLEPRKRALTLEHLLSMSSGYFCDDNNDDAPGNEDRVWDQTEQPDFYQLTLALPMASAPGERAIYCSINPNLALGVLSRAAGESAFYLFDRLVAAPMGIRRYAWMLDRARNPYGGGGMGFQSRDFIKFGQLMLDSGVWRGRRILSKEFAARATSPLYRIGSREYGLGWWRDEKPYQNGTVKAFVMAGAGGQVVMVFPELELVVATTGGSYVSRGWRYPGGELIPNYILPAIR